MTNEDLDVVFSQIRDIVMNKTISARLSDPTEEEEKIQDGLLYLSRCLNENNEFLSNLNQGNLGIPAPGRKNFLASGLKELHAIMQHIVWVAQQVADGDYTKQMDYLGDFSASFNRMAEQLRDRELKLQEQSNQVNHSKELLEQVMTASNDWIIVTNIELSAVFYSNKPIEGLFEQYLGDPEFYKEIQQDNTKIEGQKNVFFSEKSGRFYSTHSHEINWDGENAVAHFVGDITTQELSRQRLSEIAYRDELTGAYNRRYYMAHVGELLEFKVEFSHVLVDINNLKYANDRFGHTAGDQYICTVMEHLRQAVRDTDLIFRVGGDEFIILVKDCSIETITQKLEIVNRDLKETSEQFPMSISFGVTFVAENNALTAEDIMVQSDVRMYVYKVEYKTENPLILPEE